MIFDMLKAKTFFSDYSCYETLDNHQPSLQCQISCCLVTHQSEVPAAGYDWNDAVSAKASICVFASQEKAGFIINVSFTAAVLASGHP